MREFIKNQPIEYFELLYIFSSFEYALKAVGYFQNDSKASWGKFADKVNCIPVPDFVKSLVIVQKPPRKQIKKDNKIIFTHEVLNALSTDTWGNHDSGIIGAIKTVRNNLFHGGKLGYFNLDIDRNKTLVQDSIKVLMWLYENISSSDCTELRKIHDLLKSDCSFGAYL
jgi:hypothetical protein